MSLHTEIRRRILLQYKTHIFRTFSETKTQTYLFRTPCPTKAKTYYVHFVKLKLTYFVNFLKLKLHFLYTLSN